jgi:hypothetical protein
MDPERFSHTQYGEIQPCAGTPRQTSQPLGLAALVLILAGEFPTQFVVLCGVMQCDGGGLELRLEPHTM